MTGSSRPPRLEVLCPLWPGPPPGFRPPLRAAPWRVSSRWASQVVSLGLIREAADDARLSLSERLDGGEGPGPPSGLGRRQGALRNGRVRGRARARGTASYERPVVFLQAVPCAAAGSRWQRAAGGPRRGPSQWRSAACVRKIKARIRAAGHLGPGSIQSHTPVCG